MRDLTTAMGQHDVFIVGAARTPIGAFQGALASVSATFLGSTAISGALERSGLEPVDVGETYMGNVLTAGLGQAPARQAARAAAIPDSVPAATIGKVCGSGLMSVILGTKSLRLGDAKVVVAGGMESMSQAPYLLPKARSGYRMGHGTLVDSMILDGLWDPYSDVHMGSCGDRCAEEHAFSREEQDAFALRSYERALAAQREGHFDAELIPVSVSNRKVETVVTQDEEPARAQIEKMASLRPAFSKDGTVTAANASKINDGAAALVLASGDVVRERKLKPMARVLGYAGHAQEPERFTTAPIGAIAAVLHRLGLEPDDIDLWEINEAFAVVTMVAMRSVGIAPNRVNVFGGAVALGHPIGASGARILVTLLNALKVQGKRRGLATLCIGGGEALAVVVERV